MRFAFALLVLLFLPPGVATAVPPPDPWRLRAEIQAFVTADSLALPAPGAVVFYGSSSIRMWHDRLAADFAPTRVIGRGFGGSTMSEAAFHVERLVSPLRPSVLVLYEGDNDIEMGRTPGDVVRDFDLLVAKLSARVPKVQIIVLSIKPSPARWAKWPAMQQANEELEALCRRHSGRMTFVDVGRPLLHDSGQPRPEMYLADRLHLSAQAYDAWRATLRPVLTEVLRRFPVTATTRQTISGAR